MAHPSSPVGDPAEKIKDAKGTAKRLLSYLKPYHLGLIFVYLFGIISVVLAAFSPKLLGDITTELFENITAQQPVNFPKITSIIVVLVVLYLISSSFLYLQTFFMSKIAGRTIYTLRKDIDEKLSRLPLNYYDTKTHGQVLSTITNDVDTINTNLQQSLTQVVSAVITVISIVVMMLLINPILTFVALLILPASILLSKGVLQKSQKYFKGQQQSLSDLNGHIEEMYSGHDIVKLFNREDENIEKLDTINQTWFQFSWKAQFFSSLMMPIINFVGNIGYIAVAVLGGIFVIKGNMSVGSIQAFIQYVRQFNEPIMQVANIANIFQSILAAGERVFAILDEPEEIPEEKNTISLTEIQGAVHFDHISFGYHPDNILIHDLSLSVTPGQKVAIVGPTGAGKTTLINLLLRFYDVTKGDIFIDGTSAFSITRENLRSIFGMVLQDTWLFHGTILENIKYGKEGATDEEAIQAAKAAYADHFIKTLPGGYDFILNEEASNVSSGQKQLLTIARAILSNPGILILDEATSNVDTRTEVLIQKAMANLMSHRTSFIIAHRLSTIRDADLILVLKEGDIIEQGNHETLMEQEGFYMSLYNSQFEQ